MTATEVAIGGALVGALAAASANAQGRPAPRPPAAPPRVVYLTDARGTFPIYLTPVGNGAYVGPRGEYYNYLPDNGVLLRAYGRPPAGPERDWDRANAGADYNPPRRPVSSPLNAKVEQGGVKLIRDGRTTAHCRTAMVNIEKWKFINNGRQIVVKSRGNHGPATVEMFNTADGSLSDKVLAFAIRKSNVAWARGFED